MNTQKENYKNLIIIPVLNTSDENFIEFSDCYAKIAENKNNIVVVSDNSSNIIFSKLNKLLSSTKVYHIQTKPSTKDNGKNLKVVNILNAFKAFSNQDFNAIFIFDDDMRPRSSQIEKISLKVSSTSQPIVARAMIKYQNIDVFDAIDTAGIYLVNIIFPFKQIWGNIAFSNGLISENDLDKDSILKTMYDELTIIRLLKLRGACTKYLDDIELNMLGSQRNFKSFVEQRIRYAYENMAIPILNLISLSLLPLLITSTLLFGLFITGVIIFSVCVFLISLTFLSKIKHQYTTSYWVCFLAPIWFLSYFISPWIANGLKIVLGGYPRGGTIIRRAG